MDVGELRQIAVRAMREARVDDGIAAYRQLLAIGPESTEAWYNLGYLLRCARSFEAALEAYGEALARGIDRPEDVHLNRAVILSEFLARDGDAERELRAAIARNPRFATGWLNLGMLYEDRGDARAARDSYARVLALDPRHPRALARTSAIDVFEGKARAVPARLTPVLANPRLPAADAAEIGFALGGALDALGRYDDAFAVFQRANQAAKAAAPPALRYDRAAHERLVDALIALPPAPPAMSADWSPVFVCGLFRSGSTLVEQMLSRHSRVTKGGELEILPALVETQLQPYPDRLAAATPEQIAAMRDAYLAEVRALYPDADMLTDKRPDNFLHIGLIKRLFPAARIVHTTRSLRDTMLSVWFQHFDDSVRYGYALDDIVHWFGQYTRLMAHWRSLYGDDIHDVAYEDVVAAPRETIAALLGLCGLDWQDAVLAGQGAGVVRTASVWQVRQPLHGRSAGRWRNYARHVAPYVGSLDES
ncbi:tetratricopeptide repeat protein [Sphingomonas ginsenosidivorax]|uniref:Tetratricopeptide repeat protein n=1 Tax=Sphingomonas ginsenosidivorax TaxID=862135 RepID=A0A5C6UC77_9SPHN|nr:sulfotransferase [Sphingomonas ginsenosidivorax]TXC69801.1 tetratricopeptide repeat protein [Sphingomonas ginsenosidivorax]